MPPVVIKIHDNDEDLDDQQKGRKWQFYRNRQPPETGSRDQAPCLCQRSPASPTHPPTLSQGMQAFSTFSNLPTTHTWPHMPSSPSCTQYLWAFKHKQVQHRVGFFPWFLSSLDPRLSSCWFINFLIGVRVRYRLWKMTPKQSRCCLSRASVAQSGLLPECPWVWDLEKLSARQHYL